MISYNKKLGVILGLVLIAILLLGIVIGGVLWKFLTKDKTEEKKDRIVFDKGLSDVFIDLEYNQTTNTYDEQIGPIKDVYNNPLCGVNITIDMNGTLIKATTNISGFAFISIPEKSIVITNSTKRYNGTIEFNRQTVETVSFNINIIKCKPIPYPVHIWADNNYEKQNITMIVSLDNEIIFNGCLICDELWSKFIGDFTLLEGPHIFRANSPDINITGSFNVTISKEITVVIYFQVEKNGAGLFYIMTYNGDFEPY